jgi:hypothetical protein
MGIRRIGGVERQLKMLKPNAKQPTLLRNLTCPYCGVELSTVANNKEHVIGRNFVPRGKLDQSWNLILNCCMSCNNVKSKLEDDISAITLQPDAMGRYPHEDYCAVSEAKRKAEGSSSSRSGKLVKHSREAQKFRVGLFPSVTAEFSLVAPPQLNPDGVLQLSRAQIAAFFYFLTYEEKEKRGYFCIGISRQLSQSRWADWGNPINTHFAERVSNWDLRLVANPADSFFKVAIRRQPDIECWSWALEWNRSLRIIGFMGDEEAVVSEINLLPSIDKWNEISQVDGSRMRFRAEVPLDPNVEDILFWS